MSDDERLVVLEITRIEAAHLSGLIDQFTDLLISSTGDGGADADPAVARLVPDAYRDDPEAARDFRSVTQEDLLARRIADAQLVQITLGSQPDTADIEESEALETLVVTLASDEVRAWLRTLAAVRLVLATRLGITDEDQHDPEDPRFGIYDWLGYRLDGLVRAVDGDS